MRLHRPVCPECGELAIGTIERLSGRAEFTAVAENGTTEYSGETEVWWEEQKTALQNDSAPESDENLPLVICPNAHDWATAIDW
jgi:hypothetical protein